MKYILFDKDGTLIHYHDTWIPFSLGMVEDFVKAFNIESAQDELLYDLGYRNGAVQPNTALAAGSTHDFYRAFGKHGDIKVIENWVKDYYAQNITDAMQDIEIIEGAKEVLKKTRELGYKNVVCTNDSRRSAQMFIDKFDLEDYVDDLVCGDDTPYSKPDTRILEPFLQRNNTSFDKMIMIGDNTSDTQLGSEYGLFTVGVLSGTGTRESLHGANDIINDVTELISDGKFVFDDVFSR